MIDKRLLFGAVCIACVALAAGYAVISRAASTSAPAHVTPPADAAALAKATSRPHMLVRKTVLDDTYGRVAVVPLDALDGPSLLTSMSCERVYFAAGRGVCLAADRGIRRPSARSISTSGA